MCLGVDHTTRVGSRRAAWNDMVVKCSSLGRTAMRTSTIMLTALIYCFNDSNGTT